MKMNKAFDHKTWLKQFREAGKNKDGFRELRTDIFKGTVAIVNAGGYELKNIVIKIDNSKVAENTEFFTVPPKFAVPENQLDTTKILS
jgi:hypothetical protein